MDSSIDLTIPNWDITKSTSPTSIKPQRVRHNPGWRPASPRSTRGAPEGDSIIEKQHFARPVQLLPETLPQRKSHSSLIHSDENVHPASELHMMSHSRASRKRRLRPAEESIDVDDTMDVDPAPVKTRKVHRMKDMNKTWELAVEKARGKPEGAASDDDTPAKPKASPVKTVAGKKSDRAKSKLKAIQNAAKILQKSKAMSVKASVDKKIKEAGDKTVKKKRSLECLKRKNQRKEKKMTTDKFELTIRAKKLWEQLRRYDMTPEKREEISRELHNLIRGRGRELVYAHDTSRVIQCVMKYGAQEQKNALFEELKGEVLDMTKSKYAKYFVRKLFKYGTKPQRSYLFEKFQGSISKLVRHKEAVDILECAYNDYANAAQRNAMIEEFYGPSYNLYKTPETKSLEDLLEKNPQKRDVILRNMKESLTTLIEKTVLQHTIIHKVFLDFFLHATDKLKMEMIEVVREGVVHMLHTRDGARVAMMCIWYGTAKDRKVIAKTFKTFITKICCEEYGHLVLLALFDAVDDTKLVHKVVLEELLQHVGDIAKDQYGRKVLLYLLRPRDSSHFHPDIVSILQQGDNNPHSKKDGGVRRRELLVAVSKPLVQFVVDRCEELVTNNSSLVLLLTIIKHAQADVLPAMRAVATIACQPFTAGGLDNFHMVEHTAGHLTLKRLVMNDAERIRAGEAVLFSTVLLDLIPDGRLKSWAACNRGCLILTSLLELDCQEVNKKVRSQLEPIKSSLTKVNFKGAQILLSKLS